MSEAASAPTRQTAAPEPSPKNELKLQRKCACGQHTVGGGECAECRKKRLAVQRWPRSRAVRSADFHGRAAAPTTEFGTSGTDLSSVHANTREVAAEPVVLPAPAPPEADAAAGPEGPAAAAPVPGPVPAPDAASAPGGTPSVEPAPGQGFDAAEAAPPADAKATAAQVVGPALIAPDGAADLAAGQQRKSEFLEQVEAAVAAEAEAALAGTGRSTDECPYLVFWFGYYRGRSAEQIESALHRYAPEARGARSAADYVPVVAARIRRGVERWARTGEVTEVPADAPRPAELQAANASTGGAIAVQLKARDGAGQPSDDPAAVQAALGPGRPMESGVRGRMERAFGRRFEHVRTHADATAHRISGEQRARAFTVGEHVAFGAGEYQPGTPVGDALIAHELAHVVQQGSASGGSVSVDRGRGAYTALEADADASAVKAVASLWAVDRKAAHGVVERAVPTMRTGLRLQRCEDNNQPAPPQQQSTPRLRKRTVSGPTAYDCGGFSWGAQWFLDNPGSTNGFIVQRVRVTFDVKDCSDQAIDVKAKTGGNVDPAWWPLWEAWEVRSGRVFIGTSKDPHGADTYGMPPMGDGTKGSISILGDADYYPGLTLPSSFTVRNKPPAGALPVTNTDPNLSGGTGTLPHNLKSTWDCCRSNKTTTLEPE